MPIYFEIHLQMYKLWPGQIGMDVCMHTCTDNKLKLRLQCLAQCKQALTAKFVKYKIH